MKIIRRKTETFEFDLDEELKRLHSCFKGKQLQRQLDIIDAMFKEKDFEKAQKLIDELPHCEKRGYWEAEYVGLWSQIFTGGFCENKYLTNWDTTYEY